MPSPQRDCQTTVTSLPTTPHKAQGSPPKQGTHVKPQHGNPRVREAGGHTARRHPPCRQNATGGRAKQHTHRPPPPGDTGKGPHPPNRAQATTEQHTHRPPPPWEADNAPPCQQQGPGHPKLTQRPELPREKNTRPAKQGTGEQTLSTERSESKVGQRAARCQESGQASAMSSRVRTECCTSNAASACAASTCMAAWGPHAENHSAKWSAAHGVPESPRMVP